MKEGGVLVVITEGIVLSGDEWVLVAMMKMAGEVLIPFFLPLSPFPPTHPLPSFTHSVHPVTLTARCHHNKLRHSKLARGAT